MGGEGIDRFSEHGGIGNEEWVASEESKDARMCKERKATERRVNEEGLEKL